MDNNYSKVNDFNRVFEIYENKIAIDQTTIQNIEETIVKTITRL